MTQRVIATISDACHNMVTCHDKAKGLLTGELTRKSNEGRAMNYQALLYRHRQLISEPTR